MCDIQSPENVVILQAHIAYTLLQEHIVQNHIEHSTDPDVVVVNMNRWLTVEDTTKPEGYYAYHRDKCCADCGRRGIRLAGQHLVYDGKGQPLELTCMGPPQEAKKQGRRWWRSLKFLGRMFEGMLNVVTSLPYPVLVVSAILIFIIIFFG